MTALLSSDLSIDETEASGFAERVAATLDSGAVSIMISIGHRTGLFDVMAECEWATSQHIADRATLSERYVREWLAVMVVSHIIRYEPRTSEYLLPAEHAVYLARDAGPINLAVYAQGISLMGAMQERLLECFEAGSGLCYEDYPGFHRIMAEDSKQTVTNQLLGELIPLVPGMMERLESGCLVLDAGCGRGSALMKLASNYPRSNFVGYDLCTDAIECAKKAAYESGLTNITFEVLDLANYEEIKRYDLITSFDAVHDQKDPADLICRLHHALVPGGSYLMQDIAGSAHLERNINFPMAAMLYATSTVHCMPISLGQGGAGLGTMWGWETAERMLKDAGFADVRRYNLPHDPMNVWFVSKKRAC